LICAAAVRVLALLSDPEFLQDVKDTGDYFLSRLNELQGRHPKIREVRGRGLMLAMELKEPGGPVVNGCLERGYIINCTQDKVLRFVPPLIVSREEIDGLIGALDETLGQEKA
jgi:acetylornithine/succinyldiaminopimelate/putrescine aminotransferase